MTIRPLRWARTSLALLFYGICSLIFTYPLIFHLTTHVPGPLGSDTAVAIWNLWWVKKALLSGHSPFFSNLILYPYGVSLIFHGMVLAKAILATPLHLAVTPWTVYNVLVLLAFPTAGFGMYLLARHLTASIPAAWVAGLIYGFSPYMLARSLGHLNYLSSDWIPFYILCLFKMVQHNRPRWTIGAGVFLLLTAYSEYYYLIYLILFTGCYLCYVLWQKKDGIRNTRFLLNFLCLGGILVIGFSPVLWVLLGGGQTGFVYAGWSGSGKYGADLLAFFTPPPGSFLYGDWSTNLFARFTGSNRTEATVFAGYAVCLLVGYAVFRIRSEPDVRMWLWITLIFTILSLGPLLHIAGNFVFGLGRVRFAIPLPYIFFHHIPFLKGARVPARFDIMVQLGLAVLCAYSLRELLRHFHRMWPVAGGIFLLISIEYLRLPFPTTPVKIPEVYRKIASERQEGTLLEIPLGWGTGWGVTGRLLELQQLYQIVHGRPLISGFASRIAGDKLEMLRDLPFTGTLLKFQEAVAVPRTQSDEYRDVIRIQLKELLENMPDFVVSYAESDASVRSFLNPPPKVPVKRPSFDPIRARQQALDLIAQTDLRYVVVHAPYTKHIPLMNYVQTLPLEKYYDRNGILAFRINTARLP